MKLLVFDSLKKNSCLMKDEPTTKLFYNFRNIILTIIVVRLSDFITKLMGNIYGASATPKRKKSLSPSKKESY